MPKISFFLGAHFPASIHTRGDNSFPSQTFLNRLSLRKKMQIKSACHRLCMVFRLVGYIFRTQWLSKMCLVVVYRPTLITECFNSI